MKTAVQISGQLRVWKKHRDLFKKYFDGADVFMCVLLDNQHGHVTGEETSDDEIREALDYFKPKSFIIIRDIDSSLKSQQRSVGMINTIPILNEYNAEIDYNKILEVGLENGIIGIEKYGLDKCESVYPPIQWCSQYYNVWKCNEIRKEYEKKESLKYDVIVRTRFDVYYTGDMRPINNPDVVNITGASSYGNFIHVDDKFFIATPEKADVICDFYNHLGEMVEWANSKVRIPIAGSCEFIFALWLLKNKIQIESLMAGGFRVNLSRNS